MPNALLKPYTASKKFFDSFEIHQLTPTFKYGDVLRVYVLKAPDALKNCCKKGVAVRMAVVEEMDFFEIWQNRYDDTCQGTTAVTPCSI
jgi:hypothetical protein